MLENCEICAHPEREEIEAAIWMDTLDNYEVAKRYGLGGGPDPGANALRQHRSNCVTQDDIDLLRSRVEGFRHRETILEELRARRQPPEDTGDEGQ